MEIKSKEAKQDGQTCYRSFLIRLELSTSTKTYKKRIVCYPSNKMRGAKKALGAPQRVIKVSTMAFELRRESAIDHRIAATLPEEIFHVHICTVEKRGRFMKLCTTEGASYMPHHVVECNIYT